MTEANHKPGMSDFIATILVILLFIGLLRHFYPEKCPYDTIIYYDKGCCIDSNLTCIVDANKYRDQQKQNGIVYISLASIGLFIQITIAIIMYRRSRSRILQGPDLLSRSQQRQTNQQPQELLIA